ncbi:MAG: 16S rRNA (cytidine(1402)-2'-O)-methyltransferase [Rhodobacteraceae bacterium]|nr:16S rRNA (cytidine(1402)-2'-O)-methyltransferase [Paracoccaceae bacterium]
MNHRITPLSPGLYLVSTPIGTARDITLRALDTLASADLLVAEDTRSLKKLLSIHGVPLGDRPVWAYHDHSGAGVRQKIMAEIAAGRSVAYASEAGTPMVSDPGFDLVRAAVQDGAPVTGAPGPTAAIAALVLSGLPTDRFLFLGFLPPKSQARRRALAEIADVPASLVIYESPKRVQGLLADLAAELGPDRDAALCRELTKHFEEILRAPLGALGDALDGRSIKGECVMVIGPPVARDMSDDALRALVVEALQTGSVRDAAALVAERHGVPRKAAYRMALELEKDKDT